VPSSADYDDASALALKQRIPTVIGLKHFTFWNCFVSVSFRYYSSFTLIMWTVLEG